MVSGKYKIIIFFISLFKKYLRFILTTFLYRIRVDGFLKQISVGDENHVWGVNSKDEVFYIRDGIWVQGNLSQRLYLIFIRLNRFFNIYLFLFIFKSSW